MSIVTRRPRRIKPVSGSCCLTTTPAHSEWISLGAAAESLTLTINGTAYTVTVLRPHPEVASRAIRLHKEDGTAYDVALTEHGPNCSCPDFIFARDGKDEKGCKHIAACKAVRLL